MLLESSVAELVDRAGLAQYASLIGVVEERGHGPGQSSGQRQPDASEDCPVTPGGQAESVAEHGDQPAGGPGHALGHERAERVGRLQESAREHAPDPGHEPRHGCPHE
jgi:hypothetical protein